MISITRAAKGLTFSVSLFIINLEIDEKVDALIKDGKIILDAPKHPVVRYSYEDDRHIVLDFRGIRNPNKLLQGLLGGRPNEKRFVSPEYLKVMIDEYFDSCNGPLIDKYGQPVYDKQGNLIRVQIRPWTLSGLALYLGISTPSLKRYEKSGIDTILDEMRVKVTDKQTFAMVLAQAKQKVEMGAETRLYDSEGYKGAQFVLNNGFRWMTQKEMADIERDNAQLKLKLQEFELKKKLLDDGIDDNNLTINIVRRKED